MEVGHHALAYGAIPLYPWGTPPSCVRAYLYNGECLPYAHVPTGARCRHTRIASSMPRLPRERILPRVWHTEAGNVP